MTIRKTSLVLLALLVCFCPALAADDGAAELPWEKGSVNLGAYMADLNSSFRLGLDNVGLGLILDTEKFLGMKTNDYAFRVGGAYRMGESMRHKFEFVWFSFDRRSEKEITEDIELPPELGGDTLYVGTTITSTFKFDIIKAKYKYSIVLDNRVDMNVGLGFYVMPVTIGLGKKGEELKSQDITAPLPVFGLGVDVILTPSWLLKQNLDIFFLKIGSFRGSILNAQMALEYSSWKHWGVGAGVDGLQLKVEADGDDYPLMDFVGSLQFSYFGAQLYVKFLY